MILIYDSNPPCKYALRLTYEYDDPALVIVDAVSGAKINCGCVLFITADGRLHRNININPEAAEALGLKLDDRGCIQFTE